MSNKNKKPNPEKSQVEDQDLAAGQPEKEGAGAPGKPENEQKAPTPPPVGEKGDAKQTEPANNGPKTNAQLATIGRIVHFHRKVMGGLEDKLECLPAVILGGVPAASNQPADARKLKVFTAHGDEVRDAMYSPTPKIGYWSWPERV